MPQYPINSLPASSSSGNGNTLVKTWFTPTNVIYSTSGQWSIAPSNLSNILDGDDGTATTEGFVGGANGYRGYINLLLPETYLNCYAEFKIGARKDSGWANYKSNWLCEISPDNINWLLAGGYTGALPATEQLIIGSVSCLNGIRAIRFSCDDLNQGGSWLKMYFVKFCILS